MNFDSFAKRYADGEKSSERTRVDSDLGRVADNFDLAEMQSVLGDKSRPTFEKMVAAVVIGNHSASGEKQLRFLFEALETAKLQENIYAYRVFWGIKNLLARNISLPNYQEFIPDLEYYETTGGPKTQKIVKGIKQLIKLDTSQGNSITVSPVFGGTSTEWQFQCDIFVIMPFAAEFSNIHTLIMDLGEELDLKIIRGDDFQSNYSIITEIWYALFNSRLVIADCTGSNANVFYELGIAHTLGKSTVLITQNLNEAPFDIQSRRLFHYVNTNAGLDTLRDELRKAIVRALPSRQ